MAKNDKKDPEGRKAEAGKKAKNPKNSGWVNRSAKSSGEISALGRKTVK